MCVYVYHMFRHNHVWNKSYLDSLWWSQELFIPGLGWRRHEIHGLCWLCGLKIHGAPLAPNKTHISMLKFVKIFISYISCQIKVIKDKMVQTCSKMVSPRPDTTGKMSIIPMNQLDPKPMIWKLKNPQKLPKAAMSTSKIMGWHKFTHKKYLRVHQKTSDYLGITMV